MHSIRLLTRAQKTLTAALTFLILAASNSCYSQVTQQMVSDYILTTYAYQLLLSGDCKDTLGFKTKTMSESELLNLAEKARSYLSASEQKEFSGKKLHDLFRTEAIRSTLSIKTIGNKNLPLNTKKEVCAFTTGYIGGRATQARDTYVNHGGTL